MQNVPNAGIQKESNFVLHSSDHIVTFLFCLSNQAFHSWNQLKWDKFYIPSWGIRLTGELQKNCSIRLNEANFYTIGTGEFTLQFSCHSNIETDV